MGTSTIPAAAKIVITSLKACTYVCSLTITVNKKTSNTTTMNVTVNAAINKLFIAVPVNAAITNSLETIYPQISAAALNVLQCAFTISLICVEYPPPIATAQGIPCCFKV